MLDPTSSSDVFVVHGGAPLRGTVRVSGAKNSALKLMAAAILCDGVVELTEVPAIADVPAMADLMRGLGLDVEVDLDANTCRLDASGDVAWHAPAEAMQRIRASLAVLGPLVARNRRARLAQPGGDRIGARTIELHTRGLEAMGATVWHEGAEVVVDAKELRGAQILLEFPSVGATENLVMAAVLADGETIIDNAAREPEIQDLCRMLVAMGARIEGIGTPTLLIDGVERLGSVTWATCPDRIETGTYAVAAALTGGDVVLERVRAGDLKLPLLKLRQTGVVVEEGADSLRVKAGDLEAIDLVTLPYPGYPTDLLPQLMVLLTQAAGTSRVTENVFESRFAFVEQLQQMGADIRIDGHHALITGGAPLTGAQLPALDVRAGAAATLAGLVASGRTVVDAVHHVDRGYAGWVPRLQGLGADVRRVARSSLDG